MKFVLMVLSILIVTVSITIAPTSAANRALSVDGDEDYVKVPLSDSLNITEALTLECWIRRNSRDDWGVIVGNGGGWADWGYHIMSTGWGAVRLELQSSTGHMMLDSSPVSDNQWHHVAATYDGKLAMIYIDGTLSNIGSHAGGIGEQQADIGIGYGLYPSYNAGYFDGVIDEVRIWKVARTQGEIQAMMNTTLSGDEPGLVAYWNFDSDGANDLSPNGNNGALNGDAQIVEAAPPDDFSPEGMAVILLEGTTVNPGDQSTVNLSIYSAKALHSFAFDLTFDPTILQAVRVEEGSFLSRSGADETQWETPQVDNAKGVIRNIRCRRTAENSVEDNAGILVALTFKANKAGASAVGAENLRLYTPGDEEIPARMQVGEIEAFPYGGISGVVLDAEENAPLRGAQIDVSTRWFRLWNVHTDGEGRYSVDRVPTGDVNVRAMVGSIWGGAYHTRFTQVHVKAGEITPNVDFELKALPPPEIPEPGSEPTAPWVDGEGDADEDL